MSNKEYKPTRDNIFFLCYFFEKFGRYTFTSKKEIANKMTREHFLNMCEHEDAFHIIDPDQLVFEQKQQLELYIGDNNRISNSNYKIPSIDDMAELYRDIIFEISEQEREGVTDSFFRVMNSPIADLIDDYNGSMYWESIEYLVACILEGKALEI